MITLKWGDFETINLDLLSKLAGIEMTNDWRFWIGRGKGQDYYVLSIPRSTMQSILCRGIAADSTNINKSLPFRKLFREYEDPIVVYHVLEGSVYVWDTPENLIFNFNSWMDEAVWRSKIFYRLMFPFTQEEFIKKFKVIEIENQISFHYRP